MQCSQYKSFLEARAQGKLARTDLARARGREAPGRGQLTRARAAFDVGRSLALVVGAEQPPN